MDAAEDGESGGELLMENGVGWDSRFPMKRRSSGMGRAVMKK